MKWWADERKAILRPEQSAMAAVWITMAIVGVVVAVVDAIWWVAQ